MKHVPNILSYTRLFAAPLLIPPCVLNGWLGGYAAAPIFAVLSVTDFLDGYYARAHKAESLMGKIVDPLADKVLLFSVIIALIAVHRFELAWAVLLMGREFFVMGLREVALSQGASIPVIPSAKIKTALQMLFFTVRLLPIRSILISSVDGILLAGMIFFSLFSAWWYWRIFYDLRQIG